MDEEYLQQKIQDVIDLVGQIKENIQLLGRPNSVAIMSGDLGDVIRSLEEVLSIICEK